MIRDGDSYMISKDSKRTEIIEINIGPSEITMELVCRIRYHDDHIAIVLKSHLLIEYLLNKIVKHKLELDPDKLIFSKKLKLLYSKGLIPDYIFRNIDKINSLRNKLVHELNYELEVSEMEIIDQHGNAKIINIRKKLYPERHYLKLLGHFCLLSLRNHMLLKLRIDPTYTERSSV
jgi:hypothetical protein